MYEVIEEPKKVRFFGMRPATDAKVRVYYTVEEEEIPEEVSETEEAEEAAASADPEIDALVAARTAAKKEKNFAEADRIRDELKARGIEIIDTPQGAKWRRV